MIEWCNKKRMLFGILALGGLSILIIILESQHLHTHDEAANDVHNYHPELVKLSPDDKCWQTSPYTIVKECDLCTDQEKVMESPLVCKVNGLKELVECTEKGKQTYRSCDRVKWIEERKFWKFEGVLAFVGFLSGIVVYVRQKQLDHRMYQRIQRQIANTGP